MRTIAPKPDRARTTGLRRRKPFLAASVACIAASFASFGLSACGSKPPRLNTLEWRIERHATVAGHEEGLSVFASVTASEADLAELWIVNEGSRLAWKLTSGTWTKKADGADLWIGTGFAALPDRGPIPRGAWRLILVDVGGEKVELPFTISGAFPGHGPPSISFASGKATIATDWPETLVLAFDAAGGMLGQANAPSAGVDLPGLFGPAIAAKTASVGAYGFDPASKMGFYSQRANVK